MSRTHVFMLVSVLVSGLGFVYKLMGFARTWVQGEAVGFAAVPLIVYLVVSTGFASLLVWSLLGGQAGGLEAPKHLMLERERTGDDPPVLPFDAEGLSPAARWVGLLFGGTGALGLAWLLWLILTPSKGA